MWLRGAGALGVGRAAGGARKAARRETPGAMCRNTSRMSPSTRRAVPPRTLLVKVPDETLGLGAAGVKRPQARETHERGASPCASMGERGGAARRRRRTRGDHLLSGPLRLLGRIPSPQRTRPSPPPATASRRFWRGRLSTAAEIGDQRDAVTVTRDGRS